MGYVTAAPAPVGMLADLLASALNPNVGAWALSPAATEIEVQTIRWLAELIRYDAACGGILVSGGDMASLVCLLAARAAKAPRDFRAHGLTGMRKLFFGSTTERVLRETTVPVLVTPPHDPGPIGIDDAKRLLHRILVPVESEQALIDGLRNLPEDERIRWRRHSVQTGDTLGAIARRYGVTVQELQRANGLRGTLIRAGSDLMVPMSSQPFSLQAARAAASRAASPAAPAAADKVVHRVRGGESLWTIARQYNVQVADLAEWNSINAGDILRVNQTLKIWTNTRFD